jgi:hypothetical protein
MANAGGGGIPQFPVVFSPYAAGGTGNIVLCSIGQYFDFFKRIHHRFSFRRTYVLIMRLFKQMFKRNVLKRDGKIWKNLSFPEESFSARSRRRKIFISGMIYGIIISAAPEFRL